MQFALLRRGAITVAAVLALAAPLAVRAEPPPDAGAPPIVDPRDQKIADLEALVKDLQAQLAVHAGDHNLVEALTRTVEALQQRLTELEKAHANEPPPLTPEWVAPDPMLQPQPSSDTGGGRALQLPDISAVATWRFNGATRGAPVENRGVFRLPEMEVGIQGNIAPHLRGDFFLAAEAEDDYNVALEEGFFTYSGLGRGFGVRGGRMRTPVGRVNPLHGHQLPYVDYPAPIRAFLGAEGLITDGAELSWLVPTRGDLFANVAISRLVTTSETEEGLGFNGGGDGAWLARAQLGKPVGRDGELGLGASHYFGPGRLAEMRRRGDLSVTEVDVLYQRFLGAYRRFELQAEGFIHHTDPLRGDSHRRFGFFVNPNWQYDRYNAVGLLWEQSQFPYPLAGKETGLSLILTRWFNESTNVQLQLKGGDLHDDPWGGVFFRMNMGFGPHSHILR